MKFLSNAHTHTTYCDGKSTLAEMVAAAQKLGFVSLGLSGHADQNFDFPYCMGGGRQEKYLEEARRVQTELAERGEAPRLWVGLEQDAFVPEECKARNRAQTDYLIASTHYLPGRLGDQWVAVDGDPELLKRCVQERYGGDAVEMARAYFDTHAAYVLAENAAIIGHFDLVRKYAPLIGLDTSCAAYQKAALDALERVRGGVLEINTGAIARGT
ncbi:MAG: PHP domain-containing protein, partial [Eubacteriales bacterium]|nr:PHP domain-containing protein [Eubacteriales bacterium]